MDGSTTAKHVLIDGNNVRGVMSFPPLADFCAAVWRWAHAPSRHDVVLLGIDHGPQRKLQLDARFAVAFSGPRADTDTDIVLAVDQLLANDPTALIDVVTNDRQLRNRCSRRVPNIPGQKDSAWYKMRGIEPPGLRDAIEWTREELRRSVLPGFQYTAESPPYLWLLDVLVEAPDEERRGFLEFVAVCPRLPPGGLAALPRGPIRVNRMDPVDKLPEGRTCSQELRLPAYGSKEELALKLRLALQWRNHLGIQ